MKSEFTETSFAKLNVVQQEIADLFMKHGLTRPEVFVVLKGMREFKMINRTLAEKYWYELKWGDPYNGMGSEPFYIRIDKQEKWEE